MRVFSAFSLALPLPQRLCILKFMVGNIIISSRTLFSLVSCGSRVYCYSPDYQTQPPCLFSKRSVSELSPSHAPTLKYLFVWFPAWTHSKSWVDPCINRIWERKIMKDHLLLMKFILVTGNTSYTSAFGTGQISQWLRAHWGPEFSSQHSSQVAHSYLKLQLLLSGTALTWKAPQPQRN